MVHSLLVPPEALKPTEADALPTTQSQWGWSVNGIAVTSLLVVTACATCWLALTNDDLIALIAYYVVPSTTLFAYGFWRVGRRITRPSRMLLYCLGAGGVAGILNACIPHCLLAVSGGGPIDFNVVVLGLAARSGAKVGIAYGCAYLLPMLIQLSASFTSSPKSRNSTPVA